VDSVPTTAKNLVFCAYSRYLNSIILLLFRIPIVGNEFIMVQV
jgi:hypothetical protein